MALPHVQKLATGGIVSIKMADVGEIAVGTSWSEPFYTTKDSVSISQGEPTKAEILVDQVDAPVYLSYEAGEFVIKGVSPDVAGAVLAALYNTTAAPYAPTGYTATGVKTNVKVVSKMWKVEFESGQSIIVCNGDMTAAINDSSFSTTALSHNITITAKAGVSTYNQGADVVMWNTVDA